MQQCGAESSPQPSAQVGKPPESGLNASYVFDFSKSYHTALGHGVCLPRIVVISASTQMRFERVGEEFRFLTCFLLADFFRSRDNNCGAINCCRYDELKLRFSTVVNAILKPKLQGMDMGQ